MDMITADDVIRAIGRYYEGGFYEYLKKEKTSTSLEKDGRRNGGSASIGDRRRVHAVDTRKGSKKELNFLASMQSRGGGEQSAAKIVELLRADG